MTKSTLVNDKHNISKVVENDLCSGCGFCAAFCPYNAIHVIRDLKGFNTPNIYEQRCTNCGLCSELCPSYGLQLSEWSKKVVNAPFYNPILGGYIEVCRGYANDDKIRRGASSGGIVTSLLIFLIKQRLIDGAIVTVMDHKEPLYAKTIFASSEEDVLRGIGSKYTPVTMNKSIYHAVKNNFRFAFVGLPCHIEALRKAEGKIAKLRKLVFLRIGLYCNSVPSLNATRYVLWRFKIPMEKIAEIKYRGNGWPGCMAIKLKSNKQIKIPFLKYWSSGFGQYFAKKRCLLCSDQTAELADISVADPWTIKSIDEDQQVGESLIVVRSRIGYEILQSALRQDYISLSRLNPLCAIQPTTLFKKRNKNSRSVSMILGVKSIPYNYPLPLNFDTVVQLLEYRINSFLASYEKLWPLLRITVFVIENFKELLLKYLHSFHYLRSGKNI